MFKSLLSGFIIVNATIAILVIIFERRRPEKTIAWLLIFMVFPPLGLILYILVGRAWKKHRLHEEFSPYVRELIYRVIHKIENPEYLPLVKLLGNNSDSPLFIDNDITIFKSGKEKFDELIKEIEKAKHHIHLEYYIVKNDGIGNKIKDVLIKKAREGIKVRFIIDKVGSIKLKNDYINELREAGVDVAIYSYIFAQVIRRVSAQVNYRNHRKIAIIDGKVGFLGGINIGDEYLGKGKLGYWRDCHIMVKGDAVLGLQGIFIDDFIAIKSSRNDQYIFDADFEEYFPETPKSGGKVMQLVKSGPDSVYPAIMHGIIKMLHMAKDHIYIETPYFVPPESLMETLKILALSGVKIKILFPGRYDHFTVYYASRSYLSELIKCGVEVYLYKKDSFLHSKLIMIDGEIASVGTANMDIRSFELNYEVNTVIYDEETTMKFEKEFLEEIKGSELLTQELYDKTPRVIKLLEAITRIFSAVL